MAFPLPPSLSPHSHFNYLQPDGILAMLSQAQRSVTSSWSNRLSQMPSLQNLCRVVSTSFTHQHLHVVNYNRGSASGRGPTGGGQRLGDSRKKRQRWKHAHHWQQLTRAQFPGGRIPAKFGCQPIKFQLYPLTHAHPANYVRVHLRLLGVYKGSRVAHQATRVRVS